MSRRPRTLTAINRLHIGSISAACRLRFWTRDEAEDGDRRIVARSRGFSLLELMIVLAIFSLLSVVAMPLYTQQVDKVRVARAIGDIGGIQIQIDRYDLRLGAIPMTLAEAGVTNNLDPWGNPYQYLSLQNCDDDKCLNANNETVKARRDGKLKPINTYFDLYSMGKDGESKQSLVSNEGQDDIVRALDGAFIGLASEYSPK